MYAAMQSVVETPGFLADARDAGMTEFERFDLVTHLAANPMAGDVMVGTGGGAEAPVATARHRQIGRLPHHHVLRWDGGAGVPP